ncbi:MAG: transcription termination/antitermination protein NusG [Firmicutes bacterium]|jgi:transcriptional antiterminator NusG|nr:transcription termination/antitermination protein NusG [Bacillota bacterium]
MSNSVTDQRLWYVVHTYSGYENKVKANLERRVESMGMEDKIFRVVVPVEDVVEYKDGKKKVTQKKVFPGYVLVEMIVTDDSWYVVRNTPGVTGFVGSGVKPIPLEDDEVFKILQNMGVEYAHSKFDFEVGETVNVMSGPFENFSGKIVEINKEKGKVRLSISMFGRETPVELDFHQIAKV